MSDQILDDRGFALGLAAIVMLAISVVLLAVTLVFSIAQTHRVDVVYNAECTYRQNLQQQVTDTEHYLSLHPNGAPAIGLSAAFLNSRLASQKAAVDSLSALTCTK